MSTATDSILLSAMALPSDQRAAIALQLLESLDHPGEEVAAQVFGLELRRRVSGYRKSEINGLELEEARQLVNRRLTEDSRH